LLISFHPIPQKSVWQSATGFTQKRHTLYAYYSREKAEFQMVFSPFKSGGKSGIADMPKKLLQPKNPRQSESKPSFRVFTPVGGKHEPITGGNN